MLEARAARSLVALWSHSRRWKRLFCLRTKPWLAGQWAENTRTRPFRGNLSTSLLARSVFESLLGLRFRLQTLRESRSKYR